MVGADVPRGRTAVRDVRGRPPRCRLRGRLAEGPRGRAGGARRVRPEALLRAAVRRPERLGGREARRAHELEGPRGPSRRGVRGGRGHAERGEDRARTGAGEGGRPPRSPAARRGARRDAREWPARARRPWRAGTSSRSNPRCWSERGSSSSSSRSSRSLLPTSSSSSRAGPAIANVFFLFAALVSLGALCLTALLLWGAVAGISSRMTFDRGRGLFTYAAWAPVMGTRSSAHPLDSVAAVEIRTHEWSDGAPSYSLKVAMADGQTFDTGSSWSRAEVEALRRRVEAFRGRTGTVLASRRDAKGDTP